MILSSLAKYFQGQKCKIKLIGVFLPGNSHSKEGSFYAHFVQDNYLLHILEVCIASLHYLLETTSRNRKSHTVEIQFDIMNEDGYLGMTFMFWLIP